jgi:hypothetical protein
MMRKLSRVELVALGVLGLIVMAFLVYLFWAGTLHYKIKYTFRR